MKFLFFSIPLFLLHTLIHFKKEAPEKNYSGKIGKYNVFMSLKTKDNKVSGTYFYENKGVEINLVEVKLQNNQFTCFETDYLNHKTAKITGSFTGGVLNGIWKNLVTQKELPVKLQISQVKYRPLPMHITGDYNVSNSESTESCKIDLKITNAKGEYLYLLKTDKRKKSGKIRFLRAEDANYIIFSGLPGDENQGNLEGVLSDGEIAIQNYGNSLNNYTRLSECGAKYIHLVKRNDN